MRERVYAFSIAVALVASVAPSSASATIGLTYGATGAVSLRAAAVDSVGNVFIAANGSDIVYKITPAGVVTVLIDESGDGAGNTLVGPASIAIDGADNVYVACNGGNAFKITPGGAISELIDSTGDGGGNPLQIASAITVDAAGTVYVAGDLSDNVFSITPGGVITEVLDDTGDGLGNGCDAPAALTTDAADNVYVACRRSSGGHVFKIAPGGAITQVIDSSGDGMGNLLGGPNALAMDAAGNLFVAASITDNVFKITPGGVITEIIDSDGDGLGNALAQPAALATDPAGNVYVAAWGESSNSSLDGVFKVTPGGVITKLIDRTGDGAGDVCFDPAGLATDGAGNLYVACSAGSTAFEISPGGDIAMIFRPVGAHRMVLAKDGSGRIFFSDDSRAYEYMPGGIPTPLIDATGDGAGNHLNGPLAIATDAAGNLYVAGEATHNAFKVTPLGAVTEIIDATGDGAGNGLDSPVAVTTDVAGNAYVAGALSDNVFKISPGGTITEIIDATGDGSGSALSYPASLASDGLGNVYVAGNASDNAFRITPGGTIAEIIDSTGDGAGHGLDEPMRLATDGADNVYLTGLASSNAFRVTPGGVITQIVDAAGDALGNPLDGAIAITTDAVGNVYVGSDNRNAFRIAPDGVINEIIDYTAIFDIQGHALNEVTEIVASGSGTVYVSDGKYSSFSVQGDIFHVTFEAAACEAMPRPYCSVASKALIAIKEKKTGREKYKLQWKNVPGAPNKGDFGNPVAGDTSIAACIYDDAAGLIAEFLVDRAGDLCDGRDCWRSHSKGWGYKDRLTTSDGIARFGYAINQSGARVAATGANNAKKGQLNLPTGVGLLLAGNLSPTIQLVTSDEVCFTAEMTDVKVDTGLLYKALRK